MTVTMTPSGKNVRIELKTEGKPFKATISPNQGEDLAGMLLRHLRYHSAVFTEDMKMGVYSADVPGHTVIAIRGNEVVITDMEADELMDDLDGIL